MTSNFESPGMSGPIVQFTFPSDVTSAQYVQACHLHIPMVAPIVVAAITIFIPSFYVLEQRLTSLMYKRLRRS